MKLCPRCKIVKPIDMFSPHRGKKAAPDGLQGWCRQCMREYGKLYDRNRPSNRGTAFQRTWYAYRNNSKVRKIPFHLERSLFEDLITDNCLYCGAEPKPINGVDRVNNKIGYVYGNVVTACTKCNFAKRHMGFEEWEAWALRLSGAIHNWRGIGNLQIP
jgi:hypothetical protein